MGTIVASPKWVHNGKEISVGPNLKGYKTGKVCASDVVEVDIDGKKRTFARQSTSLDGPKPAIMIASAILNESSSLYHWSKWMKEAIGAVKMMVPKGPVANGLDRSYALFGGLKTGLIFPRLIFTTGDFFTGQSGKRVVDKIHAFGEMISSIFAVSAILSPVFGLNSKWTEVACPVADLVTDGVETGLHVEKLVKNTRLISAAKADGTVDKAIVDEIKKDRNNNIFKVIKCVAGVAGAVLALLALALGAPVVPAVVLLIVSLVGATFSLTSAVAEGCRNRSLLTQADVTAPNLTLSQRLQPAPA